ncbi:hypothetical protein CLOP_g9558 [Closterium sp. NIES-67]|nr:hypothetical protein CLOP_g9558 [Closterium sp. NIES-67]
MGPLDSTVSYMTYTATMMDVCDVERGAGKRHVSCLERENFRQKEQSKPVKDRLIIRAAITHSPTMLSHVHPQ